MSWKAPGRKRSGRKKPAGEKPGVATRMAHLGEDRAAYHGAVVPPIFQNSLFTFEDWEAIDRAFDDRTEAYIYSRGQNPTVRVAEQKIASLAGGGAAKLFASGMAAISAVVLHCLEPGDHVVAVENIYGPAMNLLDGYLRRKMGVETTFVRGDDLDELRDALGERTRLIYLESPSSVIYRLQDLTAIAELARQRDIRTVADNSWATPIFQRPLELGIDFEVHSCSKYLGGHSDLVAGVAIGSEEAITALTVEEYELLGATMAPAEAALLTRSLRTLPMRMEHHQASALRLARFLEEHPKVRRVLYPGLESFPQHRLARQQMAGFSGLLSFELASDRWQDARVVVEGLELFQLGVSWGGHESLVYAPAISYLKELSPERFAALGIGEGTLRLSVGLEEAEDLEADLARALDSSGALTKI